LLHTVHGKRSAPFHVGVLHTWKDEQETFMNCKCGCCNHKKCSDTYGFRIRLLLIKSSQTNKKF